MKSEKKENNNNDNVDEGRQATAATTQYYGVRLVYTFTIIVVDENRTHNAVCANGCLKVRSNETKQKNMFKILGMKNSVTVSVECVCSLLLYP